MIRLAAENGVTLIEDADSNYAALQRAWRDVESTYETIHNLNDPEATAMLAAMQWLNMGLRWKLKGDTREARENVDSAKLFLKEIS